MTERAIWLDGNAIAGLLVEVFGADMTDAERGCRTCGAHSALGEHRAYRGAGVALRCPVCGDLALCIGILEQRKVVRVTGDWTLDMPGGTE